MSEPLTEDQAAEVAVRHGLAPELGRELLTGQDKASAEALAAAVAATRKPVPPGEIAMLAAHKRKRDAAASAILGIRAEDDASDGDAPDFDGGVRQPAPLPSDPEQDHNAFLSEVLAAKRNRPR